MRDSQVDEIPSGRSALPSSESNSSIPMPFSAEMNTACGYCALNFSTTPSPLPSNLSILLKTISVGLPAAPISSSTAFTAAICSSASGWLMSTTCNKQIGLDHFFERGFERFDQAVRQLADETHRVVSSTF